MHNPIDVADQQVKGIERYIPTALSKSLLALIVIAPISTFWLLLANSEKLFSGKENNEVIVFSILISLVVALLLCIALIINQMVIIYQAKHRRVTMYSNSHPHMSAQWLLNNATPKHWLFLICIFVVGMLVGYAIKFYT